MQLKNNQSRWLYLTCCVVLPGMHSIAVADTKLQLSTGADYSSGDFGAATKTTVLLAPITAKLTTGNWSFRVSAPYVSISGPSNVSVVIEDGGERETNSGSESSSSSGGGEGSDDGSGGGTTTTTVVRNRTVSGMGDTALSAMYSFNAIAGSHIYTDVITRLRLPTGDEVKGTGTGTTDYTAQTEMGIDLDPGGVYVTGGRRFLGSTKTLKRIDGWQAGAGAWLNLGNSAVLGTYYDWRQGSTREVEDPSEAGAYLTLKLSNKWKVELNAGKSFNRNGSDYNAGVMLIWRAMGYGHR